MSASFRDASPPPPVDAPALAVEVGATWADGYDSAPRAPLCPPSLLSLVSLLILTVVMSLVSRAPPGARNRSRPDFTCGYRAPGSRATRAAWRGRAQLDLAEFGAHGSARRIFAVRGGPQQWHAGRGAGRLRAERTLRARSQGRRCALNSAAEILSPVSIALEARPHACLSRSAAV